MSRNGSKNVYKPQTLLDRGRRATVLDIRTGGPSGALSIMPQALAARGTNLAPDRPAPRHG
jgi:hypothetical protein